MTHYETAEETYQNFWKLIVEKDGEVDMEQVKKELHDFHFIMGEVSKVYDSLTGGQLSKPNYYADGVINEVHNYFNMLRQYEIEDDAEDGVLTVDTTSPELWDKLHALLNGNSAQTMAVIDTMEEMRVRGNDNS